MAAGKPLERRMWVERTRLSEKTWGKRGERCRQAINMRQISSITSEIQIHINAVEIAERESGTMDDMHVRGWEMQRVQRKAKQKSNRKPNEIRKSALS